MQVQVTDQPLTSLRVMESGRIAAVGSADGSTTIVQFSDGLVDIQPNEKQALPSVRSCQQPDIHIITCMRNVCNIRMLKGKSRMHNFYSIDKLCCRSNAGLEQCISCVCNVYAWSNIHAVSNSQL